MADRRVQFGEFCFAPDTGELTANGTPVPLEHQPALVLAVLLASPGQLVARGELAAAIWPDGTHVNFDDGLNYCVRQVRAALGDDPKTPRFIETVPRRGYRFVAPVAERAGQPPFWWRRPVAAAAAVVVLVGLSAILERRPNNHHDIAVSIVRSVHDLIY
jgi:DNA-binding winged helix-turn-helix (wHTH) protein